MRLFLNTLIWDIRLIIKYGIVTIAGIICVLYCSVFLLSDTEKLGKLVVVLIFTDPVMYGFLFTAIIILFEKDVFIHQVLAITPQTTKSYLFSKAVSFTLLSVVFGMALLFSAHPERINLGLFFPALILSTFLFVFIGVIGVAFVTNFNQFIIIIPLVMLPVCLPFLSYFNLVDSWFFYIIPSQPCLILYSAVIEPVENWKIVYAVSYLLVLNYLAFILANRVYRKKILKTDWK